MISIAIIFALGYLGIFTSDIIASSLIQVVVMLAIPLLLYTLLISKNVKQTFKDTGFKKINSSMIITCLLLGVVMYFMNTFISNFFHSIIYMLGYENISSGETITLNYAFLLKEFVLTAILPAICEEFLHRGILLHAGKKCGNTRYSLLVSSILFGLMHLNINQFFYATILGALMGYINLVTDSIYPSIIIHFINNFLSIYFQYGQYMDWPLANILNSIESLLLSNIFIYIVACAASVFVLITLFILLTKRLSMLRAKSEVHSIIKELHLSSLPIHEVQAKVNLANEIIQTSKQPRIQKGTHFSITENSFMILSIILGTIITISSFIWGII